MKSFLIVLWVGAWVLGCESLDSGPDYGNTPSKNFEILWSDFDLTYPFFELKDVNWDSLRTAVGSPIGDGTTGNELFNAMKTLLDELHDPHVQLISAAGTYRFKPMFDAPANMVDQGTLERYVPDLVPTGALKWGHLEDDIIYVQFDTFGGPETDFEGIDQVVDAAMSAPGMIVDIRGNGGGSNINSNRVLSRFADRRRLVRTVRYRNGPGHGEFGAPVEDYIEPGGPEQFLGPLVVLTNRKTASAAEDFLLGIRTFPHAVVVGDTTAGTSSNPIERTLPNGWIYQLPQWIQFDPDGVTYEDRGIPPDIPRWISPQESAHGSDGILEKAVEVIQNHG